MCLWHPWLVEDVDCVVAVVRVAVAAVAVGRAAVAPPWFLVGCATTHGRPWSKCARLDSPQIYCWCVPKHGRETRHISYCVGPLPHKRRSIPETQCLNFSI